MMRKQHDPATEAAVRQLEVTALNFAYQAINISTVRSNYVRRTRELTQSLRGAYLSGEISAKAAAEAANQMRNIIMEQQRHRRPRVRTLYGEHGNAEPRRRVQAEFAALLR